MTLLYVGLSWLAGVAAAGWLTPPPLVLGILAVPALMAILLWWHEPQPRRVAVCALALLAGGARLMLANQAPRPGDLPTYNDRAGPVVVVGVVEDDPDVRDTYHALHVRAESLTLTDDRAISQTVQVGGTLRVQAPRYPIRAYGDRLRLAGRMITPQDLSNFSYRDYLARQGVYSEMRYPRVALLEPGQGSLFWGALYAVKHKVGATISRILPEPHAALLTAILLGDRSGIPKDLYEEFNDTGTSHIIVISGSNIAIVCGLLMAAGTRIVGRRPAFWLTVAGVAVYTLLVGADAPVFRAAIVGSLSVLAVYLGRQAEARTSLVLTALLMTAYDPHSMRDPSFQLSFSAAAGLIWIVPPAQRTFSRRANHQSGMAAALRGLVGDGVLVTCSAQMVTLPVIMAHFGQVSPVSLLTNTLILPAQPLVMLTGAAATLTGMVWLPAGQIIAALSWLPLEWTIQAVRHTAPLFPVLMVGGWMVYVGFGLVVVAVLGLLYMTTRNAPRDNLPGTTTVQRRLRPITGFALTACVMVVVAVWLAVAYLPDGRLHVVFLDVGQGDAILITTPHGTQALVDGGPAPIELLWALGRQMPFWDRSLDLVINTHPEADHLAGLPAVLERYQVDHVMVSDIGGGSSLVSAWQAALAQHGSTPVTAHAGMQVRTPDGMQMDILHPGNAAANDRLNNHSVVLRVTMGDIAFLLSGDIEQTVEQALVDGNAPLGATVLKVPHHGSDTSSSQALLHAVHPQLAVVSVGPKNRLGLPAPEVLQRYAEAGIPLLRTDQDGSIEVITDGRQISVRTEAPNPIAPD